MKFDRIADLAKRAIDKRGGFDTLKRDLHEARQAAASRGRWTDKARAAAAAFRTSGHDATEGGADHGQPPPAGRPSSEPSSQKPPSQPPPPDAA